jgi:hypothetical protein
MKYSLIVLVLILSACATKPKQITEIEQVKDKTTTVKIPVTTVDFTNQDPADQSLQVEEVELADSCKDEYLFFLIRYPFEGLNALKEVYDSSLVLNQDVQKLIDLSIQSKQGQISMEEFFYQTNEVNKELYKINYSTEPLLEKFKVIEQTNQTLYPICVDRLNEMMKSKKIDANQDGCELEQQKTYIVDPYSVKPALHDGLVVEYQISEKLNEIYKILLDEGQNKISLEDSKIKFSTQVEELEKSGLLEKSANALDKIFHSFQATMNAKEQCEKKK